MPGNSLLGTSTNYDISGILNFGRLEKSQNQYHCAPKATSR